MRTIFLLSLLVLGCSKPLVLTPEEHAARSKKAVEDTWLPPSGKVVIDLGNHWYVVEITALGRTRKLLIRTENFSDNMSHSISTQSMVLLPEE